MWGYRYQSGVFNDVRVVCGVMIPGTVETRIPTSEFVALRHLGFGSTRMLSARNKPEKLWDVENYELELRLPV